MDITRLLVRQGQLRKPMVWNLSSEREPLEKGLDENFPQISLLLSIDDAG